MLRRRNAGQVQQRILLWVLPVVLAPFLRGLAVPLLSVGRADALGGGLRRRIDAPGAVARGNWGFRRGVSSLLGPGIDEAVGGRGDDCGRGPGRRRRQRARGRAGHTTHGRGEHFMAARAFSEAAPVRNQTRLQKPRGSTGSGLSCSSTSRRSVLLQMSNPNPNRHARLHNSGQDHVWYHPTRPALLQSSHRLITEINTETSKKRKWRRIVTSFSLENTLTDDLNP